MQRFRDHNDFIVALLRAKAKSREEANDVIAAWQAQQDAERKEQADGKGTPDRDRRRRQHPDAL